MFMCTQKQDFLNICEFFPRTKENLIRQGTERRARFILQKNKNSIRYQKKLEDQKKNQRGEQSNANEEGHNDAIHMPSVHQIQSDEEPDNLKSNKTDISEGIEQLNKKL